MCCFYSHSTIMLLWDIWIQVSIDHETCTIRNCGVIINLDNTFVSPGEISAKEEERMRPSTTDGFEWHMGTIAEVLIIMVKKKSWKKLYNNAIVCDLEAFQPCMSWILLSHFCIHNFNRRQETHKQQSEARVCVEWREKNGSMLGWLSSHMPSRSSRSSRL